MKELKMHNVDPQTQGEYVLIGPPAGVAEEDCYSIQARLDQVVGGVFDGAPLITTGYVLDEKTLASLAKGGILTLGFIGKSVPAFILGVNEIAESTQKAGEEARQSPSEDCGTDGD